ncbi:phosphomannomutase [Pseudoalteromonas citrea]|uniref:Phosphomannomutase n=2 Tax=Pseudoalteromonas citrea TaxID=43655 RepID=A0AAD4AMP0_9GAMM|nr:phosphomannomutase [Pseudoalteromonas citrea]KAF7775459.1 phosphomannomutase [Pseudoalteromonas citrea]
MLVSSEVIKQSGVAFGTSGARGLVESLSENVCAAFTVNFINAMRTSFDFNEVAIAIDNRPSSRMMAQACSQALLQLNIKVMYFGVIPTPALAYSAMLDGIPAIMVTGSHIPFDRNGLKFYRPDGEISKQDEANILNANVEFEPLEMLCDLDVSQVAETRYIKRYTSLFNSKILSGKRIGIYEHSSAGRDLYSKIFTELGAEVIALGRSDEFVPIDTEAVSAEDKKRALEWVYEYQLDVLFSTDGDGDRPLVSDEQGEWLRGDILGLLCAKALNISTLAVPINCNSAIDLSGAFAHVTRTKIGSPYVIEAFNNPHTGDARTDLASCIKGSVNLAGFEANGGFLLGSSVQYNGELLSALPTRDALLPALVVLVETILQKSALSSLVKGLPSCYTASDRLQNVLPMISKKLLIEAESNPVAFLDMLGVEVRQGIVVKTNTLDGLRMHFNNGECLHIRPSGNAPELRCYVESNSKQLAQNLLLTAMAGLEKRLLN